jgi:hypothetical protein
VAAAAIISMKIIIMAAISEIYGEVIGISIFGKSISKWLAAAAESIASMAEMAESVKEEKYRNENSETLKKQRKT